MYSESVKKLIGEFEKLSGIGHKSAVRLAFYILESDESAAKNMADALLEAKQKVKFCTKCFNLAESELCEICPNNKRDESTICVVENVKDNLKHNIYKTIIPRNVRLAEAPSHGLPINIYDTRSTGAESYRLLAEEVISNGGEE